MHVKQLGIAELVEKRNHVLALRAAGNVLALGDANGLAAGDIVEARRHDAVVIPLEAALAQMAVSDGHYGVCQAAIALHKCDKVAIRVRILDMEVLQRKAGHAGANHLASAQMTVKGHGAVEVFLQGSLEHLDESFRKRQQGRRR